MSLIDAETLTEQSVKCDVCIIGAGPAGQILARSLCKDFDVVVVDRGRADGKLEYPKASDVSYDSNLSFRKNFANRCFHVGGAANLWAGRLVPYIFDNELDAEWGALRDILPALYPAAAREFGANYDNFFRNGPPDDKELLASWPRVVPRFRKIEEQFRTIINCRFRGGCELKGSSINSCSFLAKGKGIIDIEARQFVIACGGIETTKLMLLMRDRLKILMPNTAYDTVGHYFMDHPKITHGVLSDTDFRVKYERYLTSYETFGQIKFGFKKTVNGCRVYSNFLPKQKRFVEKLYAKCADLHIRFVKKYSNGDAVASSDLIYALEPQEVLPPSIFKLQDWLSKVGFFGKVTEGVVTTYLEMRPRRENLISIDKEHNVRVHLNMHDDEVKAVSLYYDFLKKNVVERGSRLSFDKSVIVDSSNYSDASHHMGGVRYSKNEDESVLCEDLSVRGISNLSVLSCALFPTGGVENPTFLLGSLSLYLSEVIRSKLG